MITFKTFLREQALFSQKADHIEVKYGGASARLLTTTNGFQVVGVKTDVSSRGKGHATNLMKAITKYADDRGAALKLHAIPDKDEDEARLRAFYEKHGFKSIKPGHAEMHRAAKSKISEDVGGTLYVFDIDETLFKTSAMIRVVRGNEVVRKLTNQEYNTYELQTGESYDFTEFGNAEKFNTESIPIKSMIQMLVRIHDKIKLNLYAGSKIIINTARGDFDDDKTFHDTFRDHGIDVDQIDVNKAGNVRKKIPAERKQVVVRKYLNKKSYDAAYMYDDSEVNLTYFLQLKREYPEIDFRAFLVHADGSMSDFNPR